MKQLLLSAIMMLALTTVFAQHSLEKIWESDSLTLRNPESALYDSISNSLYVSSTGSGSITRMDIDGKVIKKDWVTGLRSNMGSAVFNGFLYTTEPSGIAVVDIDKASIVKHIPIADAQMLNDVAMDSRGVIYVSDTRAAKVYRIEDGKSSVYLENMPGANGLLTVNSDLYVLTSTSFLKVDANKVITKIADGFESGLDGIAMVAENEFIITNFQGILYYIKADGTRQLLLDTRASRTMSNDISYNSKTKTLYVPSFGTNRIIAYKLH